MNKIILAIILLAVAGALFFSFTFLSSEEAPVPELPVGAENEKEKETAVVRQEEVFENTVIYEGGKFTPKSIHLSGGTELGCIIAVVNKSPEGLLLRLSPHAPKDNWGTQYPEIAPGESGLIDPRFRVEKIAFHNHRAPTEEFSVTLGPACEL